MTTPLTACPAGDNASAGYAAGWLDAGHEVGDRGYPAARYTAVSMSSTCWLSSTFKQLRSCHRSAASR